MQNSVIIAEMKSVGTSETISPGYRVWGQDFYIDLLFYHLRLRCFVVIDPKMKEFTPEYAGK